MSYSFCFMKMCLAPWFHPITQGLLWKGRGGWTTTVGAVLTFHIDRRQGCQISHRHIGIQQRTVHDVHDFEMSLWTTFLGILKNIYLFSHVGSQLRHAESFLVVAYVIFICDIQTLSCSLWDLAPQAGIKPTSLALSVQSQPLDHHGSSPV